MTRRTRVRTHLVRSVTSGALQDPNMILAVHVHSTDLSYDPVIGQFFVPIGIDFVLRRRNLCRGDGRESGNIQTQPSQQHDYAKRSILQVRHKSYPPIQSPTTEIDSPDCLRGFRDQAVPYIRLLRQAMTILGSGSVSAMDETTNCPPKERVASTKATRTMTTWFCRGLCVPCSSGRRGHVSIQTDPLPNP